MFDLVTHLFDTTGFPARWNCGNWTAGHGWLHVLSDLGVWSAYVAIPCVLGYFVLRRKDIPFRIIFLLFGAFILACGTTHLMEAIIFWWPAYRLAGVIKLFTALVSWGTVLALVQVAPKGLAMRSPEELEREITARQQAENALREANTDLETRVQERTAELAEANASLRYEREMLRITLASIGDAVIVTDLAARVTFVNSVAQTLTGWNENDARGQALEGVFHIVNEKTRHTVHNPALRALNEGTIVGLANHTILIARDGTERAIDDSAAPIRHEDGTVAGAVLVFRDVTVLRQSEARFRQIADSMAQIVWTAGPDGEIDFLNRRWTEFTGLPQTATNDAWGQLLHPDDARPAGERWTACIQTGTPFDMEIRLLDRQQGGYRWQLIRTMPIHDEAGKVVRWFGTSTDIHEQKRAEEGARFLAEASSTLSGVVDYTSTLQKIARLAVPFFADWCVVDMADEVGSLRRLAVAHADPDKVQLALELHERYPPDTNDPHGAYEVLRTGMSDMLEEIPDALIAQGAKDEEHLRIIRSLGLTSYICVPLRARERTFGVLSFVSAESGRRYTRADLALAEELAQRSAIAIENAQLYAKLRDMVTQLGDADRRKDEFLATLAHELRNPLAPLRNAVELMRRSEGDAIVMEQARSMLGRQLDQVVRLVDDLLDMSRISRGKVQVRKQRVELAAVIRSAVETVRPLIDSQAHELTITVPPQAIQLDADPTRLAQVISNLLNNAAKYTEKGGHIWLTVEQQGNEVTLSVRDTGIGIAAEHLRHIFEMFSQVAPALERSHGGLGIGLSLVRGLVELHGGTVEARSAGIGMGSEFIVRLPVANVPLAREPEAPPSRTTATSAQKRRILVVDDNRDAADSLALMLKVVGHETRTAYDGLEATQAAAAILPEVILLDIGLPKMNGYEVAKHIRQQSWGSGIALIALTGWGQEEDKRRAFEAGFDHHLTKPVQAVALEKLLALINPVSRQ
jgi:PAS domain S-box-containing protein